MVWLVLAVLVAVVLTTWITFTLTRLDRLHARVDAAQAAMDAQLVRRAAALQHVAQAPDSPLPADERGQFDSVAQAALDLPGSVEDAGRERAENAVGRAVAELAGGGWQLSAAAADELQEASVRVLIARRFYNDAVRDTRSLRARRMPRLLHLAGRRGLPEFFDIDDTVPPHPGERTPSTPSTPGTPSSVPPSIDKDAP